MNSPFSSPIYSHNPNQENPFPLLVLNVRQNVCIPCNEGFRVLHWHEEVQFVYVLSGTIHVKIYDQEFDVSAGDCVFINCSVLHRITEKECCHYHSYLIPKRMLTFFPNSKMESSDVQVILQNPTFTHYRFQNQSCAHALFFEKLSFLDRLYFQETHQTHREYRLSIALTSLWLEFILLLPEQLESAPSKDYERIRAMLSLIHTRYFDSLSIEEIASAAHISKSECLRCFRRFIQDSPYQYLMKYRLHVSAVMLKTSKLSVTEIAFESGFHCVSSYIRYFKKQYQKTPYEYRISTSSPTVQSDPQQQSPV